MYQLSKVTPDDLARIQVKNQAKIEELTGSRFDPKKAFTIIKNESDSFKKENKKAKEADHLFVQLLKLNGIAVDEHTIDDKEHERIRIEAEARQRALDMIELELELAA